MNTDLATKTDLAELKSGLEKTIVQNNAKNVTWTVTCTGAIVGVYTTILIALFT